MSRRVCIEPGCPTITDGTRCDACERAREAARGSSGQRGYGKRHRALRDKLEPLAYGRPCHFCGLPMLRGQRLALDHTEDRAGYRGMVHLTCNAADGGRRHGTT